MPELPQDSREYLRGVARTTVAVTTLILAAWFAALLHSSFRPSPGIALLLLAVGGALFAVMDWPHRIMLLGLLAAGVIFFDAFERTPAAEPLAVGAFLRWQGVKALGSNCASLLAHALDLATKAVFLQALGALGILSWFAGQNRRRVISDSPQRKSLGRLAFAGLIAAAAGTLWLETDFQYLFFALLIGAQALFAVVTGRWLTALLTVAFCGALAFHAALGPVNGLRVYPTYDLLLILAFVALVSERPPTADPA
jgi:hypothetical protein